MGGHGGLNILPQKSWNVYGRENRLKVARDEAQHAEEEQARMEKQREVCATLSPMTASGQGLAEVKIVPDSDCDLAG